MLKSKNKVNNVFYLTQYIKNIISMCNQFIIIKAVLHSFVHTKSSKSGVYFILIVHLSLQQPHFKPHMASGDSSGQLRALRPSVNSLT